ncbi:hypothetical protein SLEP1_g58501 [Rubroshorea leprosula]|uniref:Uncharacterized protein n=1 Tax=Rubroshorea leprosula TaxID=152421 RepID=A0AAV5MU23_9ROSI|nr:hypothetical protein SLEP1_g58501 [Rubroshorea leprosula]
MLLPSQQRISALMRRLLLCCNSRHPSPSITLFRFHIIQIIVWIGFILNLIILRLSHGRKV